MTRPISAFWRSVLFSVLGLAGVLGLRWSSPLLAPVAGVDGASAIAGFKGRDELRAY